MKIIGLQDSEHYLAIVNHTELEKSVNKYYGNMIKLKVGDSMDLAQGYEFARDIKCVCEKMTEAMKSFEQARDTLLKFAAMISELENGNEPN